MSKITVGIMHAPWSKDRDKWLDRTRDEVTIIGGRSCLVAEDEGWRSPWPTARKAWLALEAAASVDGAEYAVLLQDDVRLCRAFVKTVETAIGALVAAGHKAPRVGLYATGKIVDQARAAGESWAWIGCGTWGPGYALPVAEIRPFVEWCDRTVSEEFIHDDCRLSIWARATGTGTFFLVPSVVAHAGERSLLGHRQSQQARWFLEDPASVDWTKGAVRPVARSSGPTLAGYAKAWKVRWK